MNCLRQTRHYYYHFLFLIAALVLYLVLLAAHNTTPAMESMFWRICYGFNTIFVLKYCFSFSLSSLRLAFLTFSWVIYGALSDCLADGIYMQIMLPLMILAIASLCLESQVPQT